MYLLLENLWWKRHISTEKEEIFTHKKVSLVICISDTSPHLATDKICCKTSGEQEKKKNIFLCLDGNNKGAEGGRQLEPAHFET